ncbi:hypothetical protein KGQ19_37395 [Catenulispora sp. NL8]|uniref:Uncharacterized protein n=1 Tax=Catenulispora pinistramenti TaxID=2705254 RepID=A0ABS5L2I9_9ACTN|nr:hypothetical protein [Catenulispora pinistramenti]MBS2552546.1 hypothetical protein [Catenulispora pinistramenti]
MTSTDAAAVPTMGEACHSMLLRLAGRVPDELLTLSRGWLAAHEPENLAQAIVAYCVSQQQTLPAEDAALLRWILEAAGFDPVVVDQIETTDPAIDAQPTHVFAPASPEVIQRRGHEFGPCLDLTSGPDADLADLADLTDLTDDLDRAGIDAMAGLTGAVALWRAWRSPADGAPWPAPRRVFLLAVAAASEPWQAAATLQDRLAELGEPHPQVEAFTADEPLPGYQKAARAASALLWTRTRSEPVRLAPVYDEASDGTPTLATDRPRLAGPERAAVAASLAAGALVLSTTARLDDLLRPEHRGRVPMSFRTDGVWVWSDAIGYYVREHGVAPVAEFLDHLRSGPAPDPDAVAVFRATAALTRPLPEPQPEPEAEPEPVPEPVRNTEPEPEPEPEPGPQPHHPAANPAEEPAAAPPHEEPDPAATPIDAATREALSRFTPDELTRLEHLARETSTDGFHRLILRVSLSPGTVPEAALLERVPGLSSRDHVLHALREFRTTAPTD